jgi:hypothetical protein
MSFAPLSFSVRAVCVALQVWHAWDTGERGPHPSLLPEREKGLEIPLCQRASTGARPHPSLLPGREKGLENSLSRVESGRELG